MWQFRSLDFNVSFNSQKKEQSWIKSHSAITYMCICRGLGLVCVCTVHERWQLKCKITTLRVYNKSAWVRSIMILYVMDPVVSTDAQMRGIVGIRSVLISWRYRLPLTPRWNVGSGLYWTAMKLHSDKQRSMPRLWAHNYPAQFWSGPKTSPLTLQKAHSISRRLLGDSKVVLK